MIYIFYVPQLRTGKLDLPYQAPGRTRGGRAGADGKTIRTPMYYVVGYVLYDVQVARIESSIAAPFTGSR